MLEVERVPPALTATLLPADKVSRTRYLAPRGRAGEQHEQSAATVMRETTVKSVKIGLASSQYGQVEKAW